MIELLYTGVIKEGLPQTNPLNSIGGYVSSSLIPNGSLDNIFTGASYYALVNRQTTFEVSAIVLKNNTSEDITNVTFWFNVPIDSMYKYEIAFVELAEDSCGAYMELLSSRNALPYTGTFQIADVDNKRNIGDVTSLQKIGVWIKRSVVNANLTKLTDCDSLYEDFKLDVDNTMQTEEVTLNIQYNE